MKGECNNRQKGAVLATALLFLVVMTVFAVSAWQVTTSNERQAANFQHRTVTQQTAEVAISDVIRVYAGEVAAGTENHLLKKTYDATGKQLNYPLSPEKLTTVDGVVSLPGNTNAEYQSVISYESGTYQRRGDDTNLPTLLFLVQGKGDLTHTGAHSEHNEGISIPKANITGFTQVH